MDDAPDTGRFPLERAARPDDPHAPATKHDLAPVAAGVALLLSERDRQRGAAWAIRALGGVLVTVALGMGGRALSLAETASADHLRVAELQSDVEALERSRDETRAELSREVRRLEAAGGELTSKVSALDAIVGRLEDVERRRPRR